MELSSVQEEYLKTIYLLELSEGEAKVTSIANRLNKSKASVNSAINNLNELGLIKSEKYGPITLTKVGNEQARKIVAGSDIVTLFLSEILGVEKSVAESEATKVKNALSDESLNKLARYTYKTLGFIQTDCGYDINNKNCFNCGVSVKVKKIINKQGK